MSLRAQGYKPAMAKRFFATAENLGQFDSRVAAVDEAASVAAVEWGDAIGQSGMSPATMAELIHDIFDLWWTMMNAGAVDAIRMFPADRPHFGSFGQPLQP